MNLQELLAKLDTPIIIRPTRRMTQGELETYLDKAADILRGNADHSEFRGYVFALLFYKRISDCYEEEVRTQVDALSKAGMQRDQAILLARDPQNYHFTVPEHAAWADVARSAKGQLGQALNDAMLAIERANAHRQNNFDGILTGKIDFNKQDELPRDKQDELPRDKLVNLINHFSSQTFDRAHVSDDLFGKLRTQRPDQPELQATLPAARPGALRDGSRALPSAGTQPLQRVLGARAPDGPRCGRSPWRNAGCLEAGSSLGATRHRTDPITSSASQTSLIPGPSPRGRREKL